MPGPTVDVEREAGTVTSPTGADPDPIVTYEGLSSLNARVVREATAWLGAHADARSTRSASSAAGAYGARTTAAP